MFFPRRDGMVGYVECLLQSSMDPISLVFPMSPVLFPLCPLFPGLCINQDDQDDSSWFGANHPDSWAQTRMVAVFFGKIFFWESLFFSAPSWDHPGLSLAEVADMLASSGYCLNPDPGIILGFIGLPSSSSWYHPDGWRLIHIILASSWLFRAPLERSV